MIRNIHNAIRGELEQIILATPVVTNVHIEEITETDARFIADIKVIVNFGIGSKEVLFEVEGTYYFYNGYVEIEHVEMVYE